MCTAVVISAQRIERVFWSRDDLAIVIPADTTLIAALHDIRAILHDLGAPTTRDLTCWCGEPITLPTDLLEAINSGTPTHEQPAPDPK
jgi:hypothetical protein